MKENFFTDKRILITGASSGIGKEMAIQCATKGASLALLARREKELKSTASQCQQNGSPKTIPITCDVTQRDQCQKAVSNAVETLGSLDIVILNAGVSQGCYFEDIQNLDDAEYILQVNIMGCINILHFTLPHIPKRSSSSRIVIVGSIAGAIATPYRTLYATTKWGINGFAHSLRMELNDTYGTSGAPRVVVLNPPEVKTELNGGRLEFGAGMPAETVPSALRPVESSTEYMLRAVVDGRRVQYFGWLLSLIAYLYGLMPSIVDWIVLRLAKKTHDPKGQKR